VLFGAGVLAGVDWRVSLVAALGLALSSTAIALQVMGERNLLPTSSGQSSFSILLFQDVAAIPILALVPLLAGQEQDASTAAPLLQGVKVIAVIAAIVLGGRLALRPCCAGSRAAARRRSSPPPRCCWWSPSRP
jgi:glutathione-regulated potassium-efflux system ancillary protein KefC